MLKPQGIIVLHVAFKNLTTKKGFECLLMIKPS
jgi:hypothetical protein